MKSKINCSIGLLTMLIFFPFISCYHTGPAKENSNSVNQELSKPIPSPLHIISPLKNAIIKSSEGITIQLSMPDSTLVDSILIRFDGVRIHVLNGNERSFHINTSESRVGITQFTSICLCQKRKNIFQPGTSNSSSRKTKNVYL